MFLSNTHNTHIFHIMMKENYRFLSTKVATGKIRLIDIGTYEIKE